MTKDEFIQILHDNCDEEIELKYFDAETTNYIFARFCPVEHGQEYCDVTYTDTRRGLFYTLSRPIHRGGVFLVIDGLEEVIKKADVAYKPSKFSGDYYQMQEEYRREHKAKIEKVEELKRRKEKAIKKGVYVIKAGKFVKIGVTTNFASRMNSMQTASAETFELICFFDGASYELEKRLHKEFGSYWVRGEWFSLKIKDKILKLHSEYRPTAKQANA